MGEERREWREAAARAPSARSLDEESHRIARERAAEGQEEERDRGGEEKAANTPGWRCRTLRMTSEVTESMMASRTVRGRRDRERRARD